MLLKASQLHNKTALWYIIIKEAFDYLQQVHALHIRVKQPSTEGLPTPNETPWVSIFGEEWEPENMKQLLYRLSDHWRTRHPAAPTPPCHNINSVGSRTRFKQLFAEPSKCPW